MVLLYLIYGLLGLLGLVAAANETTELDPTNLGCVIANSSCDQLPPYLAIARLSQRDMSYSASISQVATPGVALSHALFNKYGYTLSSLETVESITDVGFNSLLIDVYWSETNKGWQLCPEPFPSNADGSGDLYEVSSGTVCQDNVTLSSVYSTVASYMRASDNSLAANAIYVYLRVHSLPATRDVANRASRDSQLLANLVTRVGGRLLLPSQLDAMREYNAVTFNGTYGSTEGFPSLNEFLYSSGNRIMGFLMNGTDLHANITYPLQDDYNVFFDMFDDQVFESVTSLNGSCTDLLTMDVASAQAHLADVSQKVFRTVYDTNTTTFTNMSSIAFSNCGYSLMFNSTLSYLDDLRLELEKAIWSWAPGQPTLSNATAQQQDNKVASAYSCAVATPQGWTVENCYKTAPVVCRNKTNPFDWKVTNEPYNYFEAAEVCTGDYIFTVPRTSLENTAVKVALYSLSDNATAWIDLNSMAVSNCWVTGGTTAQCPYSRYQYNRNTIALAAVAGLFCLVLLALMSILSCLKLPLHVNQGKWRKLANKFAEAEYEGVPA